jgi:hypothetical protein
MNSIPTPRDPDVETTRSTKRRAASVGLAFGLVGGTAAGLVFGVPGLSNAADTTNTRAAVLQQAGTDTGNEVAAGGEIGPRHAEHGERLRAVLQELVDDGTLTAEQADAVTAHLQANRPETGARHGGGLIGRGGPGPVSEEIAEALGLDVDTLRDELRSGSTLADVAAEQGVDIQVLVDLMVAEAAERVDQAVANGRLDEARAAEKLADIEERVTAHLNGEHPAHPHRPTSD